MAKSNNTPAIPANTHILNLFPRYNFQKIRPERATVPINPLREYVRNTAAPPVNAQPKKNSRLHPFMEIKKYMENGINNVITEAMSLGFCIICPQPAMREPKACP